MSAADLVYVTGTLFASVLIPSVPSLIALRGAGPRYRAALRRSLGFGWLCAALAFGWVVLGGFALSAGPRWVVPYRELTLVLMGASFALLPFGIRGWNRALRAARDADRAGTFEPPTAS